MRPTRLQRRYWHLGTLFWFVYLLFDLPTVVRASRSGARTTVQLALLAVLVVAYLYVIWRPPADPPSPRRGLAVAAMAAVVAILVLLRFPGQWAPLLVFVSLSLAVVLSRGPAVTAIALTAAATTGLSLWQGVASSTALLHGTQTLIAGLGMLGFLQVLGLNLQLFAAREELARMAVAQERLRFARDLHDLLGHSLSVIALKSELAGGLLAPDPRRAAGELRDIEQVARRALAEVREAVGGYRQVTLAAELGGARAALDAAGVRAEVEDPRRACRCRSRRCSAGRSARRPQTWSATAAPPAAGSTSRRTAAGSPSRSPMTAWRRPRTGARQTPTGRFAGRATASPAWPNGWPRPAAACGPARGPTAASGCGWSSPCGVPRMTIRVLLAEDQGMVRGALAALLSLQHDIEVVAEVERGDQVVPAALEHQPDVALLDIEMPGMDGLAAAAALRQALPGCRALILTTFGRPGYLRRAMDLGVYGFLVKDGPAGELAAAIRRAATGQRTVDPGLAAAALAEGASPLSEREREVLAAARDGGTAAEIAARLYLSQGTVRNHLSSAIRKTGARSRLEALRTAEDRGWL